ncbi:DUF4214 domain-containing protein [Ramlibacter sp. PS4R-6]|uniref:DUF4214 domain-containing protein n=1 Tax=Ramlibacter sp. PS4R-6 TaxID=3133438 RepID=UPI0030B1B919
MSSAFRRPLVAASLASSLVLAAALTACGGGGGTPAPTAQPMAATAGPAFAKARSAYSIAKTASGYTVTDLATGQQTAATASQFLTFSDVTVNLQIAAQAATLAPADLQLLTELYVAFFNRVPEADGLNFWIEQRKAGQTINAIADAFYAAAIQYSDITGYTPTMTNSDFVNIVYRNVLGRASADAEGLAYWSGALASGKETRGTLVSSILGSAHTFKGNATWGWVPDLLDNKLAVATSFAISNGLNYKDAATSITKTMQIAAAVTPTSTSAAMQLVTAVVGTGSGSSGSAGVATYDEASIPGYDMASTSLTGFVATNRGLYMQALDGDAAHILKLHGNPIFNDWTSVPFADGIYSYAPLNVYTEADRQVSFYWNRRGVESRWGLYTANTGSTPGFDVEDNMSISLVAAGGTSGVIAPRPWVVAGFNSDLQSLYQDDGAYTSVRKTSDYFGTAAAGSDQVANLSSAILVAHPTDGTVFVGLGNKLRVFSASGLQSTATLPGDSAISDMFWHDNVLYIGYGAKVYKRTAAGAVSEFAQLTGIAATLAELFPAPGRFCLNGGDVITADGMARRISDGYTRSWLSSGTLTTQQQQELAIVQSQVAGAGVWCSPNNLARVVYTVDLAEGKVRMFSAKN